MSIFIKMRNLDARVDENSTITSKQIMTAHGKTFALAAKLLEPESRYAATELYAFARTVDDYVDMQATSAQLKLNVLRLQETMAEEHAAMQMILQNYGISPVVLHAFLLAQANDEDGREIATQQCLINYAYGVAGSIGSMMRPILGATNKGEIYAVSLGIAMQLTNIARDLVEDATRKRIYIPATFFSVPIQVGTIQNPTDQGREIIFLAITQLLNLAKEFYDYATLGYRYIPYRNRLSIAAAADMYKAIGVKIVKNGHNRYWQGRVSINKTQKLGIAFLAMIRITAQLFLPKNSKPNNETYISTSIALAIAHYQNL